MYVWLFGLSFLGGEMKAQQKSAHETGLRSKSTSELAELEQVITKVNYDESKVPVYTLPDVLTLTNGRKVTTKKEWVGKAASGTAPPVRNSNIW